MNTFLKEFIRKEKTNIPIGAVVAVNDGGRILLGYSLCSPSEEFNKKLGTAIALARATADKSCFPNVCERQQLVTIAWDKIKARAIKELQESENN
jgi:hypothetical protein|tara:strand:+ start:99 stop:383 length:285 start_codon:yes stop_codon:yes gene_type:complete